MPVWTRSAPGAGAGQPPSAEPSDRVHECALKQPDAIDTQELGRKAIQVAEAPSRGRYLVAECLTAETDQRRRAAGVVCEHARVVGAQAPAVAEHHSSQRLVVAAMAVANDRRRLIDD